MGLSTHRRLLDDGLLVEHGSIPSDPRLSAVIARARRSGVLEDWRPDAVLRHNPLRRLVVAAHPDPAASRTVLDLLDSVAEAMAVRPERLQAYTHAARLRLVCVHAFRPGARSWLEGWRRHSLLAQGARLAVHGP